MSILKAIDRAYRVAQERNWDRIYWSLDLHGTVLEGTYNPGEYRWISEEIPKILSAISEMPETKLIIWSSMYEHELTKILSMFAEHGIWIFDVNQNPREENTKYGCFDQKFYTSLIVDDKAGFDPADWDHVYRSLLHTRSRYGFDRGEKQAFLNHLSKAAAIVAQWPDWKQKSL